MSDDYDAQMDAMQQWNDATRKAEACGMPDPWHLWRHLNHALETQSMDARDRRLVEAERDRVAALIGVLPTRSAA